MQNTNKKLTIFIATYNRAKSLSELLQNLQRQSDISKCREDYEVIVSDNASTDNTQNVISEYIEKCVIDKALTNPENIGPDLNMLGAQRVASGRYVWLLCDDDLPVDNAISEVIGLIDKYPDSGLFYINRTKEEMNGKLTSETGLIENNHGIMTGGSVVETVGQDLITASCLVINKRAFEGQFTKKYGGSGRCSTPLALAIDGLLLNNSGYVSKWPMVRYRYGDNSGWNASWYWIWLVSIPMILIDADKKLRKNQKRIRWEKIDDSNAYAVILMLLHKKAWPKIKLDWIWITANLMTQMSFYKGVLKLLIKKIKG